VSITKDNIGGLTRLCEEFHSGALSARLSQFCESDELKEDVTQKDLEARKRLLALEERMQHRDSEIAALRTELSRHSQAQESTSDVLLGRVARLEAVVSPLITAPVSALAHSTVPTDKSPPPSIVPSPSVAPTAPTSPLATPPSGWNSAIVADFPKLFEDFKQKQFTLLWRGSRDGFRPRDFHSRCDGHPNTLTVILDTKGNIFGGFTPVEWESDRKYKADPSMKSFLFTLKNPDNVPARRFALQAEENDEAIFCRPDCGPHFCDICVYDNCNANTLNFTSRFGRTYANDTGLDKDAFFTGSGHFQVKEIEVFEISA
jgi:hypothetical protein